MTIEGKEKENIEVVENLQIEKAQQSDGLDVGQDDDYSSNDLTDISQRSEQGLPEEIYSKKIRARSRVFFVDLKKSGYGKFLKISEKSRGGKKTTVIMDQEDIPQLIEALEEVKQLLD